MVLAKTIRTIRKDIRNSSAVTETSKVLKLLNKKTDNIAYVYKGYNVTLIEVDGSIEILEASESITAKIAGEVVERFQEIYDGLKFKLANA